MIVKKNKKISYVFALIVLIVSLSSKVYAGIDWVGNGGNLISCEETTYLELFDYFEGRTNRGVEPSLGVGHLTWERKAEYALQRLQTLNPSRAELYRKWLKEFKNETSFFADGYIPGIPDTGGVVLPTGCKLLQAALQRPSGEIMPGDKRYVIDLNYWNVLNETSKAGLVLHELIYREGIEEGHISSVRVRYFNQMISSELIHFLTQKKYIEIIKIVGLRYADYYGYEIDLKSAKYYPTGEVQEAQAPKTKSWIKFDIDGKAIAIIPY